MRCAPEPLEREVPLAQPGIDQCHRMWGHVPLASNRFERGQHRLGFSTAPLLCQDIAFERSEFGWTR